MLVVGCYTVVLGSVVVVVVLVVPVWLIGKVVGVYDIVVFSGQDWW